MDRTAMGRPLSGLSILVVEDEYLIAFQLAQLIRDNDGTPLGPTGNLAAARKLIEARRISGALLDVKLDGHTSLPLADELIDAGTPIVFVTGYGAGQLPEKYARVPRLSKPVEEARLLQLMVKEFAQ